MGNIHTHPKKEIANFEMKWNDAIEIHSKKGRDGWQDEPQDKQWCQNSWRRVESRVELASAKVQFILSVPND